MSSERFQTRNVSVFLFVCLVLPGLTTAEAPDPSQGTASTEVEFVDSWIIVKLETPLTSRTSSGALSTTTGFSELDARIADSGVWKIEKAFRVSKRTARDPEVLEKWGLERIYKFHMPVGSDIPVLVDRFKQIDEVEYAEPDYIVRGQADPNDPLFEFQWNLLNTGQYDGTPGSDIDATLAWDLAVGADVTLAIIDSGIDSDHAEFINPRNKILEGWDFINGDDDPEDDSVGWSHGTRISSIAAAHTNTSNVEGIAGICWGCLLMPVKVLDQDLFGQGSSVVDGNIWAIDHGADVLNNSGGTTGMGQAFYDALGYASDLGVFFVASTGNEGLPEILFPARYAQSIAVATSRPDDSPGNASNWGRELDVLAPGNKIWGATIGGSYGYGGGTSYAAPHVTGVLGVMLSVNPSLGREEGRRLIHAGAEDLVGDDTTPGWDIEYGFGRLNMHQTLLGTISSLSLRVEGKDATRVYFDTPNPLATSYDFIRGDLEALSENPDGVDLGSVVCLENDSVDADTLGFEDSVTPPPGHGFFYLARPNAGSWPGSYGGSSRHRDRVLVDEVPAWKAESDEKAAEFAISVHSAGDVNNDGFGDVVIGSRAYEVPPMSDSGAALVYLGSVEGLEAEPVWVKSVLQQGCEFGRSVASAGNVNGDDYDDVIVGAPAYYGGETDEGRVSVYHGSPSGPSETENWSKEGDQAGSSFGYCVDSAGDVNNDGFDDVIIGAHGYSNGQANEGRAVLYAGSHTGLRDVASWTKEGDQSDARMGQGVAGVGDVNNDNFDDVIVGAPFYDNGETDEGKVFVYLGSSLGLGLSPAWQEEIDVAGAQFGTAVAGAGDVNNDGYDDVIVGAPHYSGPEVEEGRVFLYLGSASGPGDEPAWSFESNLKGALLGTAVAGAGDINLDGYDDVVVGSRYYHLNHLDEGRVWVFLGSPSGLSAEPAWTEVGRQPDANFGVSVCGAGDVDNDGYDDVIVGASEHDNGQYNEGRAYVYMGSEYGLPSEQIADCDRP